jgi:hypothetical protein
MAFAGAPKLKRNGEIITYVDPDTQEAKVLYEWSPAGANKALETLMRHRGMLTDRHQVEHHDVVYTLDLGAELDHADEQRCDATQRRGGKEAPEAK